MIRFLNIQNLAVVEKLELELQPGLTVLTGETGAGKSIVLGALGLLVGGRATSDLLRTGESKAVVQAIVENDQGREIILRREITAQGRSRAFIDNTLATASRAPDTGAAANRSARATRTSGVAPSPQSPTAAGRVRRAGGRRLCRRRRPVSSLASSAGRPRSPSPQRPGQGRANRAPHVPAR